jgi:hypothetical protein
MNNNVGQNISNHLLTMPDEVLMHMLNFLSDGDLAHRVPLVCLNFLRVSQDERLWKERTFQRFGEIKGNQSFQMTQSWKATYVALRKLEIVTIKTAIEKKQKVDDKQQRTMRAASSIFGFNVNPNQSHYYPTGQSNTVMFGGKVRKITVYNS